MRYFCEIQLLESEEIPLYFLWSKVFQQVHLALVKIKDNNNTVSIGISFPDYIMDGENSLLGKRLRLFAKDPDNLVRLRIEDRLLRMRDYIQIKNIQEVPQLKTYAHFYRQQFKSTNPERLARRFAKRHNISFEEALEHYKKLDAEAVVKSNKLPYIHLQSASTGQRHRLFIVKKTADVEVAGRFNTYGLSKMATIPCF